MECRHCRYDLAPGAEACVHCGTLTNPAPVHYFHTPPWRFICFSIITLGLYRVYWFYKNWAAVKKAEGLPISPFWRAFWFVFFGSRLLRKIYSDAQKYGYKSRLSGSTLSKMFLWGTFGYLVLGLCLAPFLQLLLSHKFFFITVAVGIWCIAYLIGPILVWWAMLSIQPAIKFHNTHAIAGYQSKRSLSRGEKILLVLFSVWISCGVLQIITSQTWKKFHAPSHTFEVMLPKAPEQELGGQLPIEDSDLTICYDVYSSSTWFNRAEYSIEVLQYPREEAAPRSSEEEENILAIMLEDEDQSAISSKLTKWNGFLALDFVLDAPNKHWRGRIIAADERWYFLIADYKKGFNKRNKKNYNKFINSFTLKKPT